MIAPECVDFSFLLINVNFVSFLRLCRSHIYIFKEFFFIYIVVHVTLNAVIHGIYIQMLYIMLLFFSYLRFSYVLLV